MAHKYSATFSDGYVVRRTSAQRVYTHAWRVDFDDRHGDPVRHVGFAGSLELAHKALSSCVSQMGKAGLPVHFNEVQPVCMAYSKGRA